MASHSNAPLRLHDLHLPLSSAEQSCRTHGAETADATTPPHAPLCLARCRPCRVGQQWCLDAGFDLPAVRYGSRTMTYSAAEGDDARRAWGESWSQRTLESNLGEQAVEYGIASCEELEAVSAAWQAWADDPGSVFLYANGEVLAER